MASTVMVSVMTLRASTGAALTVLIAKLATDAVSTSATTPTATTMEVTATRSSSTRPGTPTRGNVPQLAHTQSQGTDTVTKHATRSRALTTMVIVTTVFQDVL